MNITVRPATAADVAGIHPGIEGVSYRAWAADIDGVKAGVVGLALTRPRACLFCWFDEALRPHIASVKILRLLKKVHNLMIERGKPVYALRDKNEPKAEAILARLGLTFAGDEDGEAIYVWEPR